MCGGEKEMNGILMSQLKHPTWWGAVNAVIWGGKIAQSKSPSCFKNMTKCCKWHVAQPKTISNKWLHPTRGGVGLKNKSINIKKQRLLPYKQDKSIVRTTRLLKFSDHNFKLFFRSIYNLCCLKINVAFVLFSKKNYKNVFYWKQNI